MINVLRNPYIAVRIQPVQIPDRAGLLYRSIAVWFLRFVYGVLLQYLLTSGIGFNVAFDRRKASVGLFMRKQRCLCHTYIYIYIANLQVHKPHWQRNAKFIYRIDHAIEIQRLLK